MGPGGPRFSAGPALLNASKSNQQYGAFTGNLKEGWGWRSRKRIGDRGTRCPTPEPAGRRAREGSCARHAERVTLVELESVPLAAWGLIRTGRPSSWPLLIITRSSATNATMRAMAAVRAVRAVALGRATHRGRCACPQA